MNYHIHKLLRNWNTSPKFSLIHNRPVMTKWSALTCGSLWTNSGAWCQCPRAGSDPNSSGTWEQRFLLWPLLWPWAIRGILQEMFSSGVRIQTLCHSRNNGSKALLKGNTRHSVGAPSRLLQDREISGNPLQTNMLLCSWQHRIIRGICSLTDEPVRHMGCRWLTPCLPLSSLTETWPEPLLPLHPLAKPQDKYCLIKMVSLPHHSPRKLHPKCTEISSSSPPPIIKLKPRAP